MKIRGLTIIDCKEVAIPNKDLIEVTEFKQLIWLAKYYSESVLLRNAGTFYLIVDNTVYAQTNIGDVIT